MSMLVAPLITTFAEAVGRVIKFSSVLIYDDELVDFSIWAPKTDIALTPSLGKDVLLAASEAHTDAFILVGEELVITRTHTLNQPSPTAIIPHLE